MGKKLFGNICFTRLVKALMLSLFSYDVDAARAVFWTV